MPTRVPVVCLGGGLAFPSLFHTAGPETPRCSLRRPPPRFSFLAPASLNPQFGIPAPGVSIQAWRERSDRKLRDDQPVTFRLPCKIELHCTMVLSHAACHGMGHGMGHAMGHGVKPMLKG